MEMHMISGHLVAVVVAEVVVMSRIMFQWRLAIRTQLLLGKEGFMEEPMAERLILVDWSWQLEAPTERAVQTEFSALMAKQLPGELAGQKVRHLAMQGTPDRVGLDLGLLVQVEEKELILNSVFYRPGVV